MDKNLPALARVIQTFYFQNLVVKTHPIATFVSAGYLVDCVARARVTNQTKNDTLAVYPAAKFIDICQLAEQSAKIYVRRLGYLNYHKTGGKHDVSENCLLT